MSFKECDVVLGGAGGAAPHQPGGGQGLPGPVQGVMYIYNVIYI